MKRGLNHIQLFFSKRLSNLLFGHLIKNMSINDITYNIYMTCQTTVQYYNFKNLNYIKCNKWRKLHKCKINIKSPLINFLIHFIFGQSPPTHFLQVKLFALYVRLLLWVSAVGEGSGSGQDPSILWLFIVGVVLCCHSCRPLFFHTPRQTPPIPPLSVLLPSSAVTFLFILHSSIFNPLTFPLKFRDHPAGGL